MLQQLRNTQQYKMIYYNSYLDNRGVNEDDMELAALWRHPPSLVSLSVSGVWLGPGLGQYIMADMSRDQHCTLGN